MTEPTARFTFQRSIEFAIRQSIQNMVKTMIPGIVQKYDPATKRADIQPAIQRDVGTGKSVPRALMLDVPVIATSTGGVMVHHPLVEGDVAMVLFSERGIGEFKKYWKESKPSPGRYFNVMDAVAIRWGLETLQPVDNEAFCIQSTDGNTYFKLKDGLIEMRCGDKMLRMTPSRGDLT